VSIEENPEKSNSWPLLFIFLVVILVAVSTIGLIRLIGIQQAKADVWIETLASTPAETDGAANSTSISPPASAKNAYVASKNGKVYYLPACSGAMRIKEENKVWFVSKKEAEKAGFQPSTSCPGL
jgi:hypothetical protein